MDKQCLDVQQMQHLQELGLELKETMLYWVVYEAGHENNFVTTKENAMEVIDESCGMLPAYTLQDVLDALPKCITNDRGCIASLVIDFGDDKIGYYFKHGCAHIGWVWKSFAPKRIYDIGGEKPPRLLDTAYAMLCWCIENKFVETNKNE